MNFSIERLNKNSILVRFGQSIDKSLPPIIAQCAQHLVTHLGQYILDYIPSYNTLLLVYDEHVISAEEFLPLLDSHISSCMRQRVNSSSCVNRVEIPVFYDVSVAPDLELLASNCCLSVDDVIAIHSSVVYTVFTIGFLPGFAYMGAVDERIAQPRIATPSPKVEAGSVGIAGVQTGVYPIESPGGWNIIGQTPLKVLDITAGGEASCRFAVGDEVCFIPIGRGEFDRLVRETK